jgi:acetylornithine deacetylase/succinyl-diaminopimelate desuccinylase-like protein
MQIRTRALAAALPLVLATTFIGSALAAPADDGEAAFRDLYKQLVEINTTRSVGSCTEAAEAMQKRLLAAGVPASDTQVLAPPDRPQDGALIAMLHGRDASLKPLLLMAHMDVVEANPADWDRDPFKLVEEGGYFYARGVSDDKAMAAIFTDAMIRYRQQGFSPLRSIKLALTCGEETPEVFNSVEWLLKDRPAVLDAAMALNEGGDGELDENGKPVAVQVEAAEKVYQDFRLSATDSGGHSSHPKKYNPITALSAALVRLGAYRFPVAFNDASRAYFTEEAKLVSPKIAADMRAVLANPADSAAVNRLWDESAEWNGMLHTTCVVTMINGGHARNALPQSVSANVNCRIMPGTPVAEVQTTVERVLADSTIKVEPVGEPGRSVAPPPLTPRVMGPVHAVADSIWPGIAVVPTMITGATDGFYLNSAGIPTYGMSGILVDPSGNHEHGLNERVRVTSLMNGRRFLFELVKRLANEGDPLP